MREALKYGTVLIAIYLVAYYATGAGTFIDKGSAGATNIVKAFQGR